ncbi:MAG: hypothetical protein EBR30_20815 [Cytophagia bacterium]|nr:hypothetical protein [Cytophagia bacterium]NBW37410.1 hypothetical protein [Cytophagia bacterium]
MYLDGKILCMKYADLDFSHQPHVIVRVNPIDPTEQQFENYLEELNKVAHEMKNGVLIFEISKAKFLSSEKRIKIGNWLKTHDAIVKKNICGFCYVNTAFIPMTILKGILMVNKPPVPYTVLSSEKEAMAWAKEKMAGDNRS